MNTHVCRYCRYFKYEPISIVDKYTGVELNSYDGYCKCPGLDVIIPVNTSSKCRDFRYKATYQEMHKLKRGSIQ